MAHSVYTTTLYACMHSAVLARAACTRAHRPADLILLNHNYIVPTPMYTT